MTGRLGRDVFARGCCLSGGSLFGVFRYQTRVSCWLDVKGKEVVRRRDLAAQGVTTNQLHRLIESGRVERVGRGLFLERRAAQPDARPRLVGIREPFDRRIGESLP